MCEGDERARSSQLTEEETRPAEQMTETPVGGRDVVVRRAGGC